MQRTSSAPERLRVATYNVHSWIGRDGRRAPERTCEVIGELDAGVVALQEVRGDVPGELAGFAQEQLHEQGYSMVHGPTLAAENHGGYGNALLLRKPATSVARLDLSEGFEPRGALSVEVDCSGLRLRVVSTHLGLRARERERQVDRILAWIATDLSAPAPDLLVLLGDFNEWRPGARCLRRIQNCFGPARAARSFPARWPAFALDRIWVQPAGALALPVRAHGSRLARIASDHLPVVADFALPDTGCGATA